MDSIILLHDSALCTSFFGLTYLMSRLLSKFRDKTLFSQFFPLHRVTINSERSHFLGSPKSFLLRTTDTSLLPIPSITFRLIPFLSHYPDNERKVSLCPFTSGRHNHLRDSYNLHASWRNHFSSWTRSVLNSHHYPQLTSLCSLKLVLYSTTVTVVTIHLLLFSQL